MVSKRYEVVTLNADPTLPTEYAVRDTKQVWYCSGFTQNQAHAVADRLNQQDDTIFSLTLIDDKKTRVMVAFGQQS